MAQFKLAPDADVDGTHSRDRIVVSPRRMVEVFGPPAECDGYKVSGTYTFTDEAGNVFTVYDWKSTSLFDDYDEEGETGFPTPEEFWSDDVAQTLEIGGRDAGDFAAFKRWLSVQLA